jgi:dTDP-4-dehydrorhamnose reductase
VKVVVTGADGQVGWELRRSLQSCGDVVALDRAACDLSRPADAARIVRELKPGILVNAAAYTAVDKAETEEPLATLINGTAVGAIAETARQIGALLIHYSTDYVFDGTKDSPYDEDDLPQPINAYGRSKLAGERAIVQCGGRYLILRTSWVYAARGQNFLRTILRLAGERDELRIVADQIGAPTWAREIAGATASIARQAQAEHETGRFASALLHMPAAGETSWFGFARAILERAPPGLLSHRPNLVPITSDDYPVPAPRPKNSRLAKVRLRDRYGVALPDWATAIAPCMADIAIPTAA